jgi:hypothetical protein
MKTSRLRMKMLPTKKKHAVSWLRAKSQRRKPPLIEPVPWRELVEPSAKLRYFSYFGPSKNGRETPGGSIVKYDGQE